MLSFLHTQYYDDVKPHRTVLAETAVALVATAASDHVDPPKDADRDTVLGILDIDVDLSGGAATIETIATHPDHQAHGIATALRQQALPMLAARGVTTLDAWTREDQPAIAWYRKNGFAETFRYIHVHVGGDADLTGFATPQGCTQPVTAFVHAPIEQEAELRTFPPGLRLPAISAGCHRALIS